MMDLLVLELNLIAHTHGSPDVFLQSVYRAVLCVLVPASV